MTTATVPPLTLPAAALPPALGSSGQRLFMDGVSWSDYEKLLEVVGDRRVFITYDRGKVELVSPLWTHDNRSDLIGAMIRNVAEGLRVPVRGGGSTTFRRKEMDRGIEPDRCFYVANELRIRANTTIDLSVDPPPDLCVEVEMSSRLLDRVGIYAALGVPELWRDDGRLLRVFALSPEGTYVEATAGLAFPTVSPVRLNRYLDRARGLDETTWAGQVRRAARKLRPAA